MKHPSATGRVLNTGVAGQAGAKHVYGIECSAIADQGSEIVRDNGYEDRVTIIRGKVDEIDLPVPKVLASPHLPTLG